MIARLRGILAEKSKDQVIIDVQGVGYDLHVPELAQLKFPEIGETICLEIYTHVREDQISLYGFLSKLEKDTFLILMSASGVGPKVALSILSALEARQILEGIANNNKAIFHGISGVGKKTVEKIFVEVGDKADKRLVEERGELTSRPHKRALGIAGLSSAPWAQDLEQALQALGFKDNDIRMALHETLAQANELPSFDLAVKFALQFISAGTKKSFRGTA